MMTLSELPRACSRKESKIKGMKKYFTGKPCKYGHIAERRTSTGTCLFCSLEQGRKWEKNNAKRRGEQRHLRRVLYPEKERCRRQKYRQANPEKIAGYARKTKTKNRDKIRCYQKEYRKNHLIEHAIYQRKRNGLKRRADGYHTKEDIEILFSRQNGKCAESTCAASIKGKILQAGGRTTVAYDVDHIVPLSGGGSNWPSNLQLLCPKCNRKKYKKDPLAWAKENGRLL